MEFRDVVFGRRSVRKYTDEPVSDEDLSYLMEAACYAPSAVDLQPWYFVVVKSKEQMDRLVAIMGEVSANMEPHLAARFKNHPEVVRESTKFLRMLGGAPVCVLAFWQKKEYAKTESTIVQSVGAAIENLTLAAYDRGLGTCWMTAMLETGDDVKIREAFAPDHGPLVAMISVGHPDASPKAPARKEGRYQVI